MKTTLVIHPKDATTDFLNLIYRGRGWKVIAEEISPEKLLNEISIHERIVMLGHGAECGLIGWNYFVINSSFVEVLKNKECVYIWCHADKFVQTHKLKGFYTGMIISERSEAVLYQVDATDKEIEQSNSMFASGVKNFIFKPNMTLELKSSYKNKWNAVVKFNQNKIYSNFL